MIKALLATSAMLTSLSAVPAFAQEKSAATVRLDHVAIHVSDQPKSVAFYQELFALAEIPSPFPPGGPRWLKFANGVELHIQPGRTAAHSPPRQIHFAVTVPSLDPVIAWLRAHNVVWVDSADRPGQIARSRRDGVQQIFFQDPDGYWIEVNDVKPG